MWWVRTTGILVTLVASLAMADVAQAQVFIDPGSPSGKEYEIPFESARRGAQPGTDPSAPVPQGERNAVPFGEGISGNSAGGGGSGRGGSAEGGSGTRGRTGEASRGDGRRDGDARESRDTTSQIADAAASNPGAPASSIGSTALYVGGGALVLALGVGAGVLLRRRRAQP